MLKRIFTPQQIAKFFHIAIIINLIELVADIIIYHYIPNQTGLELFVENLSNLSIFMICLTILSQAMFIFRQNHQQFISKYKLIALTIEIGICSFFYWIFTIDNDIQEKFIIFCSKTSYFDHSLSISLSVIIILIMLMLDFYTTIKFPVESMDQESLIDVIKSTFRLVIKEHLLILISFFGIFHFEKLHKFGLELAGYTESTLFFDFSLLEIIIPLAWIIAVLYYIYLKFVIHDNKVIS